MAVALRTLETEPPVLSRTSWIAAELEPTDSSIALRAAIRRRSVSVTVSVIDWAKVRMRPSISSARPVKAAARVLHRGAALFEPLQREVAGGVEVAGGLVDGLGLLVELAEKVAELADDAADRRLHGADMLADELAGLLGGRDRVADGVGVDRGLLGDRALELGEVAGRGVEHLGEKRVAVVELGERGGDVVEDARGRGRR